MKKKKNRHSQYVRPDPEVFTPRCKAPDERQKFVITMTLEAHPREAYRITQQDLRRHLRYMLAETPPVPIYQPFSIKIIHVSPVKVLPGSRRPTGTSKERR